MTIYIILWVCVATKPGFCAFEPVETFKTLEECNKAEYSSTYIKKETKCLPHTMRLLPNGKLDHSARQ